MKTQPSHDRQENEPSTLCCIWPDRSKGGADVHLGLAGGGQVVVGKPRPAFEYN